MVCVNAGDADSDVGGIGVGSPVFLTNLMYVASLIWLAIGKPQILEIQALTRWLKSGAIESRDLSRSQNFSSTLL